MNPEEFADHMWKLNNYGITLTAICLGNELGLFDFLMQEKTPMTSQEIADKMKMKERYVREWLGAMVAAQIIILEDKKYSIPFERYEIIKGATAWSYAIVSWVKRFDLTKACFQKDGPWGNDYDTDYSFWSFFGGFRARTGPGFLENSILPSLTTDFAKRLESEGQILDLGCGTGDFSIALAKKYQGASVVGLDACDKPLEIANNALQKNHLSNLRFLKGDAMNITPEFEDTFDMVFLCDCLHDLPDPKMALKETVKVLRDGGKLLIIEVRPHSKQAENAGDMLAAMFYSCSLFSCLQNSLMHETRIGYGACWGHEDMIKTIAEVFEIEKKVELPMLHAIYICTKKKL